MVMDTLVAASHLYHGCAGDVLDVLREGLAAGDGRLGVSFTVDRRRARWWGSLKGRDVTVLRVRADRLGDLEPENAWPAEPTKDFTAGRLISPVHLEICEDGRWVQLVLAYCHLLSQNEVETWLEKWGHDLPAATNRGEIVGW